MPKFVEISKARGFKVGDTLFTLNTKGQYNVGKLIKREETSSGVSLVFEVPQFFDENAPAIKPVYETEVTHVALTRDKKAKQNGTQEDEEEGL